MKNRHKKWQGKVFLILYKTNGYATIKL